MSGMDTTHSTVVPAHPGTISLDTLPALFAHWRARAGGMTMEADPAPTPDPAPAPDPAPTPDPGPQPDPAPAGGKVTFSAEQQAKVDALVQERLAKETAKFEAQLKQMQADAGKTEVEKLTAERDRYKEQAEGAGKTAGLGLAKAEAKAAALAAGGRDDRLGNIIAQADLTGAVADDGTVDEAKVKAAVEKVLTDMPEWKKTAGGKSGTELDPGDGKGKPTFTREQIKAMTEEERQKRLPELQEAMAAGRITG